MQKLMYAGLVLVLIAIVLLPDFFTSAQADWKRGRAYHRLVCTSCHIEMLGNSISPMEKTISEWNEYYAVGKHDQSKQTMSQLSHYVSNKYRQDIKSYNLAAEKFIDVPSTQLINDIQAFAVRGAKDSDTPMRCQ